MGTLHDRIARRVYELFEGRGRQHGYDWANWFQAEREILGRSHRNGPAVLDRIVFLFGAGASYGATHVQPERTPLMYELFGRLAAKCPADWGPSSRHWPRRKEFQADFEQTFNDWVWQPPPFTINSLTLAEELLPIARFFGEFTLIPGGEDCYSKLLRALERAGRLKDTTLASLNYDCLLEQAAATMGVRAEQVTGDSVSPDGTVPVLKLHGSCNFVGDIDQHFRAVLASPGARVEVSIRSLSPFDSASYWATANRTLAPLPIICQLSFNKEAVLAPVAIYAIRRRWQAAVAAAGTVVIIGVAFNSRDTHVTDAVRSARSVLYVGSDGDFNNWSNLNPRAEHVGREFERSLPQLLQRLRL